LVIVISGGNKKMKISYTNAVSAVDCNKLRNSAGWPQMHLKQIETGLANSTFIIGAKDGDSVVGMARIISDGGYAYFIVDVLVLPEYQRKGIGKTMMGKIMEHIYGKLNDDYCIQIDLLAAKGKEKFYEEFGFIKRPDNNYGCGMTQRIKK
jgi:GNAT superfamily N-acetyltransferase